MINEDKIQKALNFFNKAYELQQVGKFDEAIYNYQLSIDTYPTAEAYTFLAWTYSCKGDFDVAIEKCKNAIEIDPDYGNPYNDIGSYLIALGSFEEAIYWLELAIQAKRYDKRHLPYFNLGRVMEKKSEWNEAMGYYEKSLQIKDDFLPSKIALKRLRSWIN